MLKSEPFLRRVPCSIPTSLRWRTAWPAEKPLEIQQAKAVESECTLAEQISSKLEHRITRDLYGM